MNRSRSGSTLIYFEQAYRQLAAGSWAGTRFYADVQTCFMKLSTLLLSVVLSLTACADDSSNRIEDERPARENAPAGNSDNDGNGGSTMDPGMSQEKTLDSLGSGLTPGSATGGDDTGNQKSDKGADASDETTHP